MLLCDIKSIRLKYEELYFVVKYLRKSGLTLMSSVSKSKVLGIIGNVDTLISPFNFNMK